MGKLLYGPRTNVGTLHKHRMAYLLKNKHRWVNKKTVSIEKDLVREMTKLGLYSEFTNEIDKTLNKGFSDCERVIAARKRKRGNK